MGNYEQLKQSVSDVIKTNGNKEITGSILQNVLLTIISTVGANAAFAGIATPTTNPGTPDGPVFYLASEGGTYTNFNAIELQDGLSVLMWNGSWSSQQIFGVDDVPTAESDNLVKSGSVSKELDGALTEVPLESGTGFGNGHSINNVQVGQSIGDTIVAEYRAVSKIDIANLTSQKVIVSKIRAANIGYPLYAITDENFIILEKVDATQTGSINNYIIDLANIASNAKYLYVGTELDYYQNIYMFVGGIKNDIKGLQETILSINNNLSQVEENVVNLGKTINGSFEEKAVLESESGNGKGIPKLSIGDRFGDFTPSEYRAVSKIDISSIVGTGIILVKKIKALWSEYPLFVITDSNYYVLAKEDAKESDSIDDYIINLFNIDNNAKYLYICTPVDYYDDVFIKSNGVVDKIDMLSPKVQEANEELNGTYKSVGLESYSMDNACIPSVNIGDRLGNYTTGVEGRAVAKIDIDKLIGNVIKISKIRAGYIGMPLYVVTDGNFIVLDKIDATQSDSINDYIIDLTDIKRKSIPQDRARYLYVGTLDGYKEKIYQRDEGIVYDIDNLTKDFKNDIIANNQDVQPLIAINAWTGIPKYSNITPYKKYFTFAHISDTHGEPDKTERMLQLVNSKEFDFIDLAIHTGDHNNDEWGSQILSQYFDNRQTQSFIPSLVKNSKKPFLTMAGNHDCFSVESGKPTLDDIYNDWYKPMVDGGVIQSDVNITSGKSYYYYDLQQYKIRIIFINMYEPLSDGGGSLERKCISQSQINWLIATLQSVPNDYTIIVCEHNNEDLNYDNEDWTFNYYGGKPTQEMADEKGLGFTGGDLLVEPSRMIDENGSIFVNPELEILDAYRRKSTVNKTYTYDHQFDNVGDVSNPPLPQDATTLIVNADFTNSNGILAFIAAGHIHGNFIGTLQRYPNLHECISGAGSWKTQVKINRSDYGKSKDFFQVYTVDTDSRNVYVYKIGVQNNVHGKIISMCSFNYSNLGD